MGIADPKCATPLAVAVAVAVVMGGCGAPSAVHPAAVAGSRGARPSVSASSSPAVTQLIARADAICRQLNGQLASVDSARRNVAYVAQENATLEASATKRLDRLTAPVSLARDWRRILTYRQVLAGQLSNLARVVTGHDSRAVRALAVSKLRTHRKLHALASHDGFKDCAEVNVSRAGLSTGGSGK